METRIEKLRKMMTEQHLDAMLITTPYNLHYITGFTGTEGMAIITLDKQFFVTDSRYTQQVASEAPDFELWQNRGPIFDEIPKILSMVNPVNMGFEDKMDYRAYLKLEEVVPVTTDLTATTDLIEGIRELKDAREMATIKKACEITDAAFEHILGFIKPGVSELEVANELDFYMRSLGASGMSFDTIVASGWRSAMPHGVASEKIINDGELVTLDFGCYYNGYVSDMTRTIAVGDVDDELKKIYEIVREAQMRVIAGTKAGVTGPEYDALARDFIKEAGYGENFGHGIGHGIGLEIHEGPIISFRTEHTLRAGEVITDEPGIYIEGLGGVRIEDDLIVTENGCEILTQSPKELIIL
jgi:Xaa-Pro aminopeptidase